MDIIILRYQVKQEILKLLGQIRSKKLGGYKYLEFLKLIIEMKKELSSQDPAFTSIQNLENHTDIIYYPDSEDINKAIHNYDTLLENPTILNYLKLAFNL